jgi:hypothetical protein
VGRAANEELVVVLHVAEGGEAQDLVVTLCDGEECHIHNHAFASMLWYFFWRTGARSRRQRGGEQMQRRRSG